MSTFLPSERKVVEKTSTALARTIRAAILDGRLAPDDPLPELELAQQLGTSRTPIREALLLLEREGLVEAQPNRGATVRRYDQEQLKELYDLRAILEGHAAKLAAATITDRDVRRLHESCDRFARLRTSPELLADLAHENFVFHNAILDAANSVRLSRMVSEVTAVPLIYRSYMAYSEENRLTVERDHRAITAAVEAHDGRKAARLMQAHVEWARDLAIAHFPQAF